MTGQALLVMGEGNAFAAPAEVRIAYDYGEVDLQARITVRMAPAKMASETDEDGRPATQTPGPNGGNGSGGVERIVTTVGRILLYEIVPHEVPFAEVNRTMKKKELGNLIDIVYRRAGDKATVIFADRMKDTGFEFATRAGISI